MGTPGIGFECPDGGEPSGIYDVGWEGWGRGCRSVIRRMRCLQGPGLRASGRSRKGRMDRRAGGGRRREDGEDTGRVRRTRARRLPAWALNRGRVKAGAAPAPLQVAWAHRPLPLKVLAVHGPSCQGAAPDPIPALT